MKKYEEPIEEIIYDYQPNLNDIHRYYDNYTYRGKPRGVVGNDEIRTLTPLIFGLRGVSVVVKGASGTGKTTIIKCASQMLWGDEVFVDKVPEVLYMATASKKGWLTNSLADRIKCRCTHAIAPELQNVVIDNPAAEAMVKLWTEGEAYIYTRADNFGKSANKILLEPLPMLTSIATENPTTQKLGEEMERRFLPLYTIASRETNEKVHIKKADQWARPDEDLITMTDDDKYGLRCHLQNAMRNKAVVKNPCAPFIRKVIPHTFVISDSMIELFFESIAAITTFHYPDRQTVKKGNREYLLSTPSDNWDAFVLAGESLVLASMNIPDMGKEIINVLPFRDEDNPEGSLTTNEIVDMMSEKGFERTKKQIDQILRSLEMVNYAKRDEYRKDAFYKSKSYHFDKQIDWQECLDATKKLIKEVYKDASKDYIRDFCTEPVVRHPFSNEEIKLLDMTIEAPQKLDIGALMK